MNIPPEHLLCPISGELMVEAVTIATGVSYDRKNIERWFFVFNKKTCPATMQTLTDFQITPNHTLQRLIVLSNQPNNNNSHDNNTSKSSDLDDLISAVESSPFKVSPLRKLRSMIVASGADGASMAVELMRSPRAVRVLVETLVAAPMDFAAFRAAEEAVAVLRSLPIACGGEEGKAAAEALSAPESVKSIAVMLRRASSETRLHALAILGNMAGNIDWGFVATRDDQRLGSDLLKALLELASDEIGTKAGPAAMEVMTEILRRSKKARPKAVEAGAVTLLIELLPESGRARAERVLTLISLLCGCSEGRLAFVDHAIGIAAVTEKALGFSGAATKLAVKILWLVSSSHPAEKVLEDMVICGTVKKLFVVLHMEGRSSSTKDKLVNIFKIHARFWSRYPCFPSHYFSSLDQFKS